MMDRNEDVSDNLVKEFWNNVRLGQWEVCVGILKLKYISTQQCENLLVEIILHPEKYSHGSKTIKTAFDLSRLALSHLKYFHNGNLDKIPMAFQKKINFNLSLLEVETNIPPSILQELSTYQHHLFNKEHGNQCSIISAELNMFISEMVKNQPLLAVHVIDAMSCDQKPNDISLTVSKLFCDQVGQLLLPLEGGETSYTLFPLEGTFQILNLFLKHLNVKDEEFIENLKQFHQVLLDNKDKNLLTLYMLFINTVNPEFSKLLDEHEVLYRLQKINHIKDDVIAAAQFVNDRLQSNNQEDWCHLFLISTQSKVHLLRYILDASCMLIHNKNYDKLKDILINIPLLVPLILLINWSECEDFYEALALLNCMLNIIPGKEFGGILGRMCKQLVYQTKLIDWCLQKTREILGDGYDGGPMVNQLFKQMNSSSLISVLNGANLLKTLKFEEVIELLEKKALQSTLSDRHVNVEMNQFLSFSILKKFSNLVVAAYIGYVVEDNGVKVPFTNQLVENYIIEIKNNLFEISNHSLQVEMLENIFSLLFIRSSDFQSEQEEDDIDSDIIEETSLYSSSMSQSRDSLSTIGDELNELSSSTPTRKLRAVPKINDETQTTIEMLLKEMKESSGDTLNATSIPNSLKTQFHFPIPAFLVNKEILVESFKIIDECLRKLSRSKFKEHVTEENENSGQTASSINNLDNRISRLSQYIREAQWRFELIDGVNYSTTNGNLGNNSLKNFKHNIVNDMLGSAENLVYLTLKKGDLIQASQVIKLFGLKDKECSLEVDFTVQFQSTKEKISQISKSSSKQEVRESKLGSIKSATKTGQISFEVTQIVETLFQHDHLKNISSSSQLSATVLDLLCTDSLTYNICKSLLEFADLKLQNSHMENVGYTLATYIKSIKLLLQYQTSRNLKYFELTGCQTPKDFINLSNFLPNKLKMNELEFYDSKLSQGLILFEDLWHHIEYLQGSCEEVDDNSLSVKLKEKSTSLFSIFNCETLAQLNKISTAYEYFKSLIRYVDKLASWLINWSQKKDLKMEDNVFLNNAEPLNPFNIFTENLSLICGNLIFNLEMPPKKLESLTQDIGLNLVKVISENCGVTYPSFNTQSINGSSVEILRKPPIILNFVSNVVIETNKSPNIVVQELLSNLIDMISEDQEFCPSNLTSSEVCQMMSVACIELAAVDLNMMKTNAEKTSFFINLFNLLYMHGLMVLLAGKLDLTFDLDSSKLSSLLHSPTFRLMFFKLFCYQIGEIGVLSIYDIYHTYLCGRLSGKFFGTSMKKEFCLTVEEEVVPQFDIRCLFCLSFGTVDSPLLKVVHPSSVEDILKRNMLEFLDNQIGIDIEKREIFLPELIYLHGEMFMKDDENVDMLSKLEWLKILLSSLSEIEKISKKLKEDLTTAIQEGFEVGIESHDWNLRRSLYHKSSLSFYEDTNEIVQLFPVITQSVSEYLSETYPRIGALVEIALCKYQLLKQTSVIFDSNLLSRGTQKYESLDMLPSLQHGLTKFSKFTSKYKPLKHFVLENSACFVQCIEMLNAMEPMLLNDLLQEIYVALRELLSKVFLNSLSPHDWLAMFPSLFACALHCNMCCELVGSNLEMLTFLSPHLRDLILVNAVVELCVKLQEEKCTLEFRRSRCLKFYIYILTDSQLRYHLTLESFHLLDAKDAEDLLKLCLHDANIDQEQSRIVKKRYQEVHWLNKVLLEMLSSKTTHLTTWQQVEKEVKQNPQMVVTFLIEVKAFSLLNDWCELYDMPEDLFTFSTQSKVKDLLGQENICYIIIRSVLDQIKSKETCLKICENLLACNESYNPKHIFVLQYMTTSLQSLLNSLTMRELMYKRLALSSIELVPIEFRMSFIHLRNNPLFVIEQLLINVKVTIAKNIVEFLHREAVQHHGHLSILIAECDDLIAKYAKKSIILLQVSLPVNLSPQSPQSKSPVEKVSNDKRRDSKEFIVPLQSVDKKYWVPDGMASYCMVCNEFFNMFNRRHHCRHCGRVVCAACSTWFCYIPRYKRKERVCNMCYKQNYKKLNETDDKGKLFNLLPWKRTTEKEEPFHNPLIIQYDELVYSLTNDASKNKLITDEFTFEQSPSASLCLAIIDLYSNQKAAGGLLLQFSNKLSKYLKVEKKQEVDVTMISGMIEFILKHAKLKFMKTGDFSGVELCEIHLAQVEILKLLLTSNWQDVPSMQELTRPETLRRLRDQLVSDEKYSLAIEVTNKCGLDVTPVFFQMGLSRLKSGKLEKARELFARCLTATQNEPSKSFSPNSHYLDRIVECIEGSPFIGTDDLLGMKDLTQQQQQIFSVLLQDYFKNSISEHGLDKHRYDEIFFYLATYGTHQQVLSFLLRHRLVFKAVTYVKEKKCPTEILVTCLLLPSFQDGYFESLCEHMRLNDPTLTSWQTMLLEACKYLSKHNLYHCLYEVQLFIKDYFRAALTCVRFYLGTSAGQPATCFKDLYRRIRYLQLANQHLNKLLNERKSRSNFVSHVGASFSNEDTASQETPTSEIKRHSSTINLQLSVMEYLHDSKYLLNEEIKEQKIPTLFGNGKERAELAITLLVVSVEESLPLASRIIQEFKLPSPAIFGRTCKRLASSSQYDQVLTLLRNTEQNGMINSNDKDEMLIAVIKIISRSGQVKTANSFIKLIKTDITKINAFIICGRLRDAYLEAVKKERAADIQRILDEAKRIPNQKSMVDICEKWLRSYYEKQTRMNVIS